MPQLPDPQEEPPADDLVFDAPPPRPADESWDYGDPVTFDAPDVNGQAIEPAREPDVADPAVPDAASRAAWDNTDAWDAHPPAAGAAPDAETPAPVADDEERAPAWDDTGAWDPHPPAAEAAIPPVAGPADPAPPTLGEEIASVDRGWFEDETPRPPEQRTSDEPGQETVEWDVLANRPKVPPTPKADAPSGVDDPTVEWDALAAAPKPAVPESAQAQGAGAAQAQGAGAAPAAERVPDPPTAAPNAPAGGAEGTPAPSSDPSSPRFDDEHERPVPTRRVNRARTLPSMPPGPGEKRPRRAPGKGTFAAIIGLFLLVAVLYFVNALFQPLHDDGSGSVRVSISRNSSTGDIGKLLEKEGVVDSAFFFELRARLDGGDVQAGTFTLQQGMPYGDALKALAKPPAGPPTITVTIPEGRARREAAPVVKKAGLRGSYLEATEKAQGFSPRKYGAPRKVASLEGFLFPATYELRTGSTARQLVAKQLEAFERNIDGVSMRRARRKNLSTYDVLTIASMVEREATLAKERRLIAAVIYNRLEARMPLGIDATIRYATRNWSRPLKQSELDIDSPYNTRRRTGLPPTPIGSPGLASIKAAADPANVDYLYYVVKPGGDGAHNFSSSDAEFQKDVEAYNRERERRGGKDPSSSQGG